MASNRGEHNGTCRAREATTDRYRSRQASKQARSAHRHVYVSRSVGGAEGRERRKLFREKPEEEKERERVQFVVRLETDGLKLVAASITKVRLSGIKPKYSDTNVPLLSINAT